MNRYQLIGPFSQLLPMTNLPLKGAIKDAALEIIPNGGILLKGDKIISVGPYNKLLTDSKKHNTQITELKESMVGLPGFIDAHTHICFAGTRAQDYAMRNAGQTYLEIAKAGGGIWDSVTQTRKETEEGLTKGVVKRANKLLKNGITTIEVKSGYGLSVESELKMLRAIQRANQSTVADLVATCLAAHIFPKDFDGTISQYLELISHELFPLLHKENLATRVDAFIEDGAFSPEVTLPYLQKAEKMGFDICIHADQFHTGGSQVAVDIQAVSADHLEASTNKEIELLAKSEVVAMALPGASIGIGCPFTPARKLLDAGACLAIASDWNPGSAPMGDLLTQAAILGTFEKLSNSEVLSAMTFRAAKALKLSDRGQLKKGFLADFIAFPMNDYREILYHQGQLKPRLVWKKGVLI